MSPKRDVPDSPFGVVSEGSASSGREKSRRQKPVAAGPAPDRRTRMGARPITLAPTTSIVTARARPSDISEFYRLGHNGAARRRHRHETVLSSRGDHGRADERGRGLGASAAAGAVHA